MNELTRLRSQLSAIDEEIFDRFNTRMSLVDLVAEQKGYDHSKVYVPQRQQELIERAGALVHRGLKPYAQVLMSTLMRLSRERQYGLLRKQDAAWLLGKTLAEAPRTRPSMAAVAFPGPRQSYSGLAAAQICPQATLVPLSSFAVVCRHVREGNVDGAVLPLEKGSSKHKKEPLP